MGLEFGHERHIVWPTRFGAQPCDRAQECSHGRDQAAAAGLSFSLVVLAAGRATRYGSPKQLAPLGPHGETLLEYAVYDAVRAGCDHAVLVVRPDLASTFEHHVARTFGSVLDVAFAFQEPAPGRAAPWGTGEAVLAAAAAVHSDFLVVNADDFYGSSAFSSLWEALRVAPLAPDTFAMAGYRLENTLSPGGGVSRAVCAIADDAYLVGLREICDLARDENGRIAGRDLNGAPHAFAGDEIVSMNLWAFTPAVFPLLHSAFDTFRRTPSHAQTGEFLLSSEIHPLIERGAARVRVVPTAETAVGVTFPDDRAWVASRLQRLTEAGKYPATLWRRASHADRET